MSPRFWTGKTGRTLRDAGANAQLLALYLITAPAASMSGLYYLPLSTITEESGLSPTVVKNTLRALAKISFAFYDPQTSTVWVPQMAAFQVGETLAPADKRIRGLVREIETVRDSPFVAKFYETYKEPFRLPADGPWKPRLRQGPSKPLRSPSEGSSKPLRSQVQVQVQEQDQEQDHAQGQEGEPEREPGNPGSAAAPGFSPRDALRRMPGAGDRDFTAGKTRNKAILARSQP